MTLPLGAQIGIPIGIFALWIVVTEVLLRCPLWYTKRSQGIKFSVKHSAHRGGCLLGPENTVHTFQRAVAEFGVDMIELDVRKTKDGHVVIAHDETVERICIGDPVPVAELLSEDLPHLKPIIPLHFRSKDRHAFVWPEDQLHAETGSTGIRMSTLREAFTAMPTTPMHIDIKDTDDELVRAVVALIVEFKREHLTVVGAVAGPNHDLIGELAKEHGFFTFCGIGAVVGTVVLYYTRLLPFVPVSYDAFSIPLPTTAMRRRFISFLGARNGGCCGWKRGAIRLALWLFCSFGLWRHLRRRGVVVIGWVLNDVDEWEETADWPIDGMMTDDPEGYHRFKDSRRFQPS